MPYITAAAALEIANKKNHKGHSNVVSFILDEIEKAAKEGRYSYTYRWLREPISYDDFWATIIPQIKELGFYIYEVDGHITKFSWGKNSS